MSVSSREAIVWYTSTHHLLQSNKLLRDIGNLVIILFHNGFPIAVNNVYYLIRNNNPLPIV